MSSAAEADALDRAFDAWVRAGYLIPVVPESRADRRATAARLRLRGAAARSYAGQSKRRKGKKR
jgi:hypothetical protein